MFAIHIVRSSTLGMQQVERPYAQWTRYKVSRLINSQVSRLAKRYPTFFLQTGLQRWTMLIRSAKVLVDKYSKSQSEVGQTRLPFFRDYPKRHNGIGILWVGAGAATPCGEARRYSRVSRMSQMARVYAHIRTVRPAFTCRIPSEHGTI